MRFDSAFALVALVIAGCAGTDPTPASPEEPAAEADATTPPADAPPADAGPDVQTADGEPPLPNDAGSTGSPPPMTVGAWNLHNFSKYGTKEFRIDDLAGIIKTLDVDVLGVEELKVADGTDGLTVHIGSNILFARGVYLRSANHGLDDRHRPIVEQANVSKRVTFGGADYAIVIEDDAWIGANAIIVSGAHVGRGAVIGAGSVVTGVIPPYAIAAGVPARVIGERKGGAA